MANNWMKEAFGKNKGVFRAKAKRAGMSTGAYASHVLAHKDRFTTKTIRQAVLAKRAISGDLSKK